MNASEAASLAEQALEKLVYDKIVEAAKEGKRNVEVPPLNATLAEKLRAEGFKVLCKKGCVVIW